MFLPIREGIVDVPEELRRLQCSSSSHKTFIQSLEYFLGMKVTKDKKKEMKRTKRRGNLVSEWCQKALQLTLKLTLDIWKGPKYTHHKYESCSISP